MASNPPYQLEDNTDEDFFDKLVDDDIVPSESLASTASKIAEGNESDDLGDFGNLSIGEDYGGEERLNEPEMKNDGVDVDVDVGEAGLLVADADEGSVSSLPELKTVEFEISNSTGTKGDGLGPQEAVLDSDLVGMSTGSGSAGVKEVGWSSFYADASENDRQDFGSYSDFFGNIEESSGDLREKVVENVNVMEKAVLDKEENEAVDLDNSVSCSQYEDNPVYEDSVHQSANGQEVDNSQYWENMYPGWKFDPNTGQWYQVDGYDATLSAEGSYANSTNDWTTASDGKADVSYLQRTSQSVVGTLAESSTTESVSNWGQDSEVNNGYPQHMFFDPQYPGWYYDTVAQEWRTLESYNAASQSMVQAHPHHDQSGYVSGDYLHNATNSTYGEHGQPAKYESHDLGNQGHHGRLSEPYNDYNQQETNTWQPETVASLSNFSGNQLKENRYSSTISSNNHVDHLKSFSSPGTSQLLDRAGQAHVEANGISGMQSYEPSGMQSYEPSGRQSYEPSRMQSYEPSGMQRYEPKGMQSHESSGMQSHEPKGMQSHEPSGMQSYEPSGMLFNSASVNQTSFSNNFYDRQKNQNVKKSSSTDLSGERMNISNDFYGSQKNQNNQMNFSNDFYGSQKNQNEQMSFPNDFYGNQEQVHAAQHQFQSSQQFSYAPNVGRSSAGRPSHALVTFGFGGKLILMKNSSSLQNSSYGSQGSVGSSISVLNLMEIFIGSTNASNFGGGSNDYIRALSQQCFAGPLVGGSVGSKELNKWIDERIAHYESPNMDHQKGKVLRLLLSLLKIACQHYGKLRSPFGADTALGESDTPESAVAKLFASANNQNLQYSSYDALENCLQHIPPEEQMRATASEMQNLLVSGRKNEALQRAQEGQLWGPALVLASQLGDQFYVDTVKQMALRQLVAGSPLRTLCLLIAGQPAEVFSADNIMENSALNMSQQPAQFGATGMLDDWGKNLALITANRTKDDELVILHLGDCLWKERSEVIAAHICYIVAEANFEAYSDTARLCLIGADHWKFPRTYASPEAIQRTELYEYSKVLGNSQFVLVPFQPYKLIYAHMLAEVGKVSDALKYCQSVSKSLKTGRAPEVETWKQLASSLEERIRIYQQGGYTNLAPKKLVGKLLNFFDSTAHRVVGGLPPPAPSTARGHVNENHLQQMPPRVSASQSTTTMSSLVPSASMEPISEWASDGNRMTAHNRSVSEPDFGRTPRQVDSSKAETSSSGQGKTPGSRFGRFGFGSGLLQKTVGLVLGPRSDKQAKLGETNKFYYDEKLKRWIEEGAAPPAEEAALAPPPTTSAFQNGMSDYSVMSTLKSEGSSPPSSNPSPTTSEHSSGIPPIPTSTNQFSARGRVGVRSRYVDTFNQGRGNSAKLLQTPSVPSNKPVIATNAKFFVPTPTLSSDQTMESIAESTQEENNASYDYPSIATPNGMVQATTTPSPMGMQRFPSMGNIPANSAMTTNGHVPYHSRRTSSWGGSAFIPPAVFTPQATTEVTTLAEALAMSPTYMSSSMNGNNLGDDLHEVEL